MWYRRILEEVLCLYIEGCDPPRLIANVQRSGGNFKDEG